MRSKTIMAYIMQLFLTVNSELFWFVSHKSGGIGFKNCLQDKSWIALQLSCFSVSGKLQIWKKQLFYLSVFAFQEQIQEVIYEEKK